MRATEAPGRMALLVSGGTVGRAASDGSDLHAPRIRCRTEARRLKRDPGGAHGRQSREDSGRTSHIQFVDRATVVGRLNRRAFMRARVGAMAVPVVLVHEFAAFVTVTAVEDQQV